jgi:small subunit ribosomal protein S17
MPKKSYIGEVLRNAMDKTVVVAISRLYQHPFYKKTLKRTLKLKAHDENNICNVGDKVKILESRPISKTKRWTVVQRLTETGSRQGAGNDPGTN